MRITPDLTLLIQHALKEDIGTGDVTSQATIPQSSRGTLVLTAKERGIVCGMPVFAAVFRLLDRSTTIRVFAKDGTEVHPGGQVAMIKGHLRSLLTGERVALNFLQRLSGIATLTRCFVNAIEPYPLKVYDTRKTTPLWRSLEKYAVRTGGGHSHRFGLYDMILIKDNHIDAAGGILPAIKKAQNYCRSRNIRLPIGVEVRSLDELRCILPLKIDLILLDNMNLDQIRRAITLIGGRDKPEVEISGGITIRRIRHLAQAGVRRVSIGALTHSAPAMDFSLKYSIM